MDVGGSAHRRTKGRTVEAWDWPASTAMIVRRLPVERHVVLDGIRRFRRTEEKRTGLHVSTVISDILLAMEPKRANYDAIEETTSLAFQELGSALEDVVAEALRHRIPGWAKPEPRTYRGITGSPDGFSPRARAIDEIKLCWRSEKDFFETDEREQLVEESVKFTGYKMQVLFYMKLWHAVRGRLQIVFVTGKGHPPFPTLVPLLLKPTQDEIDGNFEMIRQHAIDRRWLKRDGTV